MSNRQFPIKRRWIQKEGLRMDNDNILVNSEINSK